MQTTAFITIAHMPITTCIYTNTSHANTWIYNNVMPKPVFVTIPHMPIPAFITIPHMQNAVTKSSAFNRIGFSDEFKEHARMNTSSSLPRHTKGRSSLFRRPIFPQKVRGQCTRIIAEFARWTRNLGTSFVYYKHISNPCVCFLYSKGFI